MKKKFRVRTAKRISAFEAQCLQELHREACDGEDWNVSESDFTPVRVNGNIGFDNGAGYIFTVGGDSFAYSDADIKDVRADLMAERL